MSAKFTMSVKRM